MPVESHATSNGSGSPDRELWNRISDLEGNVLPPPTGATTSFSRLGRIRVGDISGGVEPQMREPHEILASRGVAVLLFTRLEILWKHNLVL